MKDENEWVKFQEIEWNDPKYNVFSIDTRDFCVGYRYEKKNHQDLETLKKYPQRFFHTEEEIKILIQRYFEESGGEGEWRFFSLEKLDNWRMKYIRIWRSEEGFVVCNSDNKALSKSLLSNKVSQEHLNHH